MYVINTVRGLKKTWLLTGKMGLGQVVEGQLEGVESLEEHEHVAAQEVYFIAVFVWQSESYQR